MGGSSVSHIATESIHPVVTDLDVYIPRGDLSKAHEPDPRIWHRIEKELHLHASQQCAWLYVRLKNEEDLLAEDLVVTDIIVSELPPTPSSGYSWKSHPYGIWVQKGKFWGAVEQAVTEVDVLFGIDAVDPRSQWTITQSPLQLQAQPNVPIARLSVCRGKAKPRPDRPILRVSTDGKFKILLISDTHMHTGVGLCKDAIDADGKDLPDCEADPLTVGFIEKILDIEKPDLVVLAGDQVHHDIYDTQSAIFKVVSPIIKRSIPWVGVFGNHDSEGVYALSRTEQMSILQDLPFSLCEPGPEAVDGVGNFYLQVLPLASAVSQVPLSTLYLLDSHALIPDKIGTEYDFIKQTQIDWFAKTSQELRRQNETDENNSTFHPTMVVQHIPLPEFGAKNLCIHKGHRREPTEGPRYNSGFYETLVEERVSTIFCGHDHVNDFCALLPKEKKKDGEGPDHVGPWLCHTGCAGFGGYCSYGKTRFRRGARVLELDTNIGNLKTWHRIEYAPGRGDEFVLVGNGAELPCLGQAD